jgi:hypothetical protein
MEKEYEKIKKNNREVKGMRESGKVPNRSSPVLVYSEAKIN